MPEEYLPNGTQVGTPAWIVDCLEGKEQVAAYWFVFITSSSDKAAQRPHVSFQFDTTQRSATKQVGTVAAVSEESSDAATPAGMPANMLCAFHVTLLCWEHGCVLYDFVIHCPHKCYGSTFEQETCLLALPADCKVSFKWWLC